MGDPDAPVDDCEQPDGSVDNDDDCDDADPAVHPEAEELCNDADDDCDDEIDEGLDTRIWYIDADGDGWGDPDALVEDCEQPDGTTDQLSDVTTGRRPPLVRAPPGDSRGRLVDRDGTYIDPPECDPMTVFCDMGTDGGGWTELMGLDFSADACPETGAAHARRRPGVRARGQQCLGVHPDHPSTPARPRSRRNAAVPERLDRRLRGLPEHLHR